MKIYLKPLDQQVIVITGASSGIGLTTARRAAGKAKGLVLVSRNLEELEKLARSFTEQGTPTIAVKADVADEEAVENVARQTEERFGGFDTWINNAGVSAYGYLLDIPLADQRRIFDTNYWGVVNGSLVAARRLKERGGALINIGSVLSERAIPIQGPYSASKHAVKAFTDSLRMEMMQTEAPVAVTLIKPGTIDTPYVEHAADYLPDEPQNPPPLYDPSLVARAILHAAVRPTRELTVGLGGRAIEAMQRMPHMADRIMSRKMRDQQQRPHQPRSDASTALWETHDAGRLHSRQDRVVFRHDPYTAYRLHPGFGTALMLGAGFAVLGAAVAVRRGRH